MLSYSVNCTGYLAIHLIGLSVGTILLPPSPSDFRRQQHRLRQTLRGGSSSLSSSTPSNGSHEYGKKEDTKALRRQDGKTAIELFSYAILWWTCLGVCYLMSLGGGVSRRLVSQTLRLILAHSRLTYDSQFSSQ